MTGILSLLGLFLAILAATMLLPALIAAAAANYVLSLSFLVAAAMTAFVAGGLLFALFDLDRRIRPIEVFVLAVLTWIIVPAFGAIPFLMSESFVSFNGAYFEAVSGFTTTGASIIKSLETTPDAIIAWRAILQWLGGFTTILMILIVLAPARVGGTPDRPLAMVESGARTAWGRVRMSGARFMPLYAGLTFICFGILRASGMPTLDSFSLSLSTISTGGFMPRDGGLELYDSTFIELVIGLFMFVGATSVIWHRLISKARWLVVRQYREGLWLAALAGGLGLMFGYGFYYGIDGPAGIGIADSAYKGILTALSLVSTTGFEVREGGFAALSFPLLLAVALIGGSGYSTSGGIKLYRIGAMIVQAGRELRRLIYPHGMRPAHFGGEVYDMQLMKSVWSAFLAFLISISALSVALGFAGFTFEAALTISISVIANVGPLYQALVPGHQDWVSYWQIEPVARMLLAFAMIAGRLEILAILALFNISYWRS